MTGRGKQLDEEVIENCRSFIGKQREISDTLAPEPAAKLRVLLGSEEQTDLLPPTFHWAYFSKGIPPPNIGQDMHERTGIFLPPAPFHRRMWAAGEISMLQPLRIGITAVRRSTVKSVDFKEGRSGAMCFATVAHDIEQEGKHCISEIQTIVYRDRGAREQALRQPDDPVPEGYFTFDDATLWFYSAATYNGHRIHWDREFCRNVEGYPDLVVHGPLMATALCQAMQDELKPLHFAFRATAPVFVTTPIRLIADPGGAERTGAIERSDGVVSMQATLKPL